MRTGFPLFFKLVGRTLFGGRATYARPTPKRLAKMAVVIPTVLAGQIVHRLALALDHALFPGFKRVQVKEPVFILGVPRSGTTHLHRLMAKDEDNFTTMKTWELVLAPSIVERKLVLGLAALDRKLGGYGRRLLEKLDERVFRSVRKIHKVSLFEAEEDDLVLFPDFSSIFLFFMFPFPEEVWHLTRFDTETPEKTRRRSMNFYKSCVQRHLYVHGAHRRFLSKNPAMSPKIDALRSWFPDARIVCNVRNPYNTVPSLTSFLYFNFDRFDNDRRGDSFRDLIYELAGHWYRYPLERLAEWPESQAMIVPYDQLTKDPKACVEEIYARFELPLSEHQIRFLDKELAKARAYKSKHSYALQDIGLTPEQVQRDFSDIYARFGFDTAYAPTHGGCVASTAVPASAS